MITIFIIILCDKSLRAGGRSICQDKNTNCTDFEAFARLKNTDCTVFVEKIEFKELVNAALKMEDEDYLRNQWSRGM